MARKKPKMVKTAKPKSKIGSKDWWKIGSTASKPGRTIRSHEVKTSGSGHHRQKKNHKNKYACRNKGRLTGEE